MKSAKGKQDKAPRSFSFSKLLIIAIIGGLAYYIYTGTQKPVEKVNASEANRVASPPAEKAPGLSRSEYDRQKTMTYGEAVKNSSSLSAHQQHINETEKAMQQISNTKSGK